MCEKCRKRRCQKKCCEEECKVVCCKGDKGEQGPMGPKGTALGYVEYIHSDDTPNSVINVSVPAYNGSIGAFTIDTEIVNSVGSGVSAIVANGGTVFYLTYSGTYEVDYELSPNGWGLTSVTPGGAVDIYIGATTNTMTAVTSSVAGSTVNGTWVHGRSLIKITTPTYLMISPDPSTVPLSLGSITGGQTYNRLIRLSIVQISQ